MEVQPGAENIALTPANTSGTPGELNEAAASIVPVTGEPSVDEALGLVSDLGSGTPVQATGTLGEVLQKLERILAQSQGADTR